MKKEPELERVWNMPKLILSFLSQQWWCGGFSRYLFQLPLSQLYSTFTVWPSEGVPYGKIWIISKNDSSLRRLSFQIGFFAHFYFKWFHIKPDIFGIIFCVPSWSLVHTVNGISRQGLYREWTRQAGLSFYSKPMQTEWIVVTVPRECLFVVPFQTFF